MSEANKPAFPQTETELVYGRDIGTYPSTSSAGGLSKREHFAGLALQAIIAKNPPCGGAHDVRECGRVKAYAKAAVACADALLAELEKSQ